MSLPSINPTTTEAWKQLQQHFESIKNIKMTQWFAQNSTRANDMTIVWEDFYVDYSKNRIDDKTLELLLKLADETHLKDAINKQFNGDVINETEKREVLHTALRAPKNAEVFVNGVNVIPEIYEVRQKIETFTNGIVDGSKKRLHQQTIYRYCKYWYWWFRFGSSHGGRCASILQKPFNYPFCKQY